MSNKRKFLVAIWSILTIAKLILFYYDKVNYFLFFFMGFHTPLYSYVWFVISAGFNEHIVLALIYFVLIFIFMIFWIISIIRIKQTIMFEWLMVADPIMTLFEFLLYAFVNLDDFSSWYMVVALSVQILITFIAFVLIKKKIINIKWG